MPDDTDDLIDGEGLTQADILIRRGAVISMMLLTATRNHNDGPWAGRLNNQCFFCRGLYPEHIGNCAWETAVEWEAEAIGHAILLLSDFDWGEDNGDDG